MQSEKNEYKSNPMYLYLSENYQSNGLIDVELPNLGVFFKDVPNNIGYTSNLNNGVHLYFNFQWLPNKTVPVKVIIDGKILLDDYLTFDNWTFDNWHKMYFVSVYIELKGISVGDHFIHTILDDKEYIAKEKIRILEDNINYSNLAPAPKNWETIYAYPDMSYFYSNKLFYFLAKREARYDIISYDLAAQSWSQNGTIDMPKENNYFTGSNINIGEDIYTLVWRDSIYYIEGEIWPELVKVLDIWKYNIENNSFMIETKYPGKGIHDTLFFSDNENIYMGGGHTYINTVDGKSDFWSYNLTTKKWGKKNDTPISFNTSMSTSGLFIDNAIYTFTSYRELWKYSPIPDSWEKISTMGGGSYYRNKSTLLYSEGHLYVIGGATSPSGTAPDYSYLEDVWIYNIKSNTWTLKTFFTPDYYQYPAFIFNNKIYSTNHNIFGSFKSAEIQ